MTNKLLKPLLAVTVTLGISGCNQSPPPTTQTPPPPQPPTDTAPQAPRHIVEGCPSHQGVKALIAAGKPLVREADDLLASAAPDATKLGVLKPKLAAWGEEVNFARSNCNLLLSATGESVYPEITLACDDLSAAQKGYLHALNEQSGPRKQKSQRVASLSFGMAEKLMNGTLTPRSSKVINFLADKKYKHWIEIIPEKKLR